MTLTSAADGGFTDREIRAIDGPADATMRLYTVDSPEDSLLLRTVSAPVPPCEIGGPRLELLRTRMLATVTDPANPGVGIAAPQVGILRRIILVQRFDKVGQPFEMYINPVLTAHGEEMAEGQEGCLSIPGQSGIVPRYHEITVEYTDSQSLQAVTENIEGFTAVVFQHEIDHLDGILFTDKSLTVDTYSFRPKGVCSTLMEVELSGSLVTDVRIIGGCHGNSQAVAALCRGMYCHEVIDRLQGIDCKGKGTSCPDQLSKMLSGIILDRGEYGSNDPAGA